MAVAGHVATGVGLLLRAGIRAYQLLLAPVLPPSCRYWPSCSHYAAEAIARHGPVHGGRLALCRLCRCHPWGGSGYDPVPDSEAAATR
ncbi:MAG TPA: membrane protein insertion efficiency factor YidD [Stellaceae bacterium]|nr:membrane protein insertion efficiency factor YidD [Stellaceae bacterium]